MDSMTAIEQAQRIWETDPRIRMIVQRCAIEAFRDYGWIDPDRAERAAMEIAERACLLAVTRLIASDGEIMMARAERDAYKKLAEETINLRPMPPILLKTQTASDVQ